MIYKTQEEIFKNGAIREENNEIVVRDLGLFRKACVDNLVDTIILGDSPQVKQLCYWITYSVGKTAKVIPASIQGLYEAKGIGKAVGFTVPAMNLRTLTYDSARTIFRAAKKIDAGAFTFEIAKSEIGYTDQLPREYTVMVILAAIKEGFSGSIFIQGDHFQLKAKNFLQDRKKEVGQLKALIKEAVEACFYNIDIDSSTLVDLSKADIPEQQKSNYQVCAELTKYMRNLEPPGITISVGGEIGEVGGKNSTPEEFHAFMQGYLKEMGSIKGISKMSIQTGTSHGGVVLPDGSIAKVNIDLEALKTISQIARDNYGMAGAVQHGASTLPNEAFHHFPQIDCAEIHLATQFQNIVYDYLPIPLKEKIYTWLRENFAQEKLGLTDDQFIYKTRKNALGPFKKEIHSLSRDLKNKISAVMEEEFAFLFEQLNIKNTKRIVEECVKAVECAKNKQDFFKEEKMLGELEGAD